MIRRMVGALSIAGMILGVAWSAQRAFPPKIGSSPQSIGPFCTKRIARYAMGGTPQAKGRWHRH